MRYNKLAMKKKAVIFIFVLLISVCAAALFACAPKQYTVTFELGGGNMDIGELIVEEGGALDLSAYSPTREGYTFGGWTDENGKDVTLAVINSNVTFIAKWEANENSVTYFVNGVQYSVVSARTGETVNTLAYETDESGEFFGWFTNADLTDPAGGAVTVAPSGSKLYGAFVGEDYFNQTFYYTIRDDAAHITGLKDISAQEIFIPSVHSGCNVCLDKDAFEECAALTSVYLGSDVSISGGAFAGCGVTSVICSGDRYRVYNGALYSGMKLVFALSDIGGKYEVADGTEEIIAYAFSKNKNLTEVTFPASVQKAGEGVFVGCRDDLKINLSIKPCGYNALWNKKNDSGTAVFDYDNISVDGEENGFSYNIDNNKAYIVDYDYIGSEKDIVLPQTLAGYPVSGVETYAFYGTDITSVVLHGGIEYVEREAFAYCAELKKVKFEGTKTEIKGEGVFSGCAKLTEVVLPTALAVIPNDTFVECTALSSVELPDTLTDIGSNAFMSTAINEITIPASVIRIGDYAFSNIGGRIVFNVVGGKSFNWDIISDPGNYVINNI